MLETERQKLQTYLRKKFKNSTITLKARNKPNDTLEVYLGEEFIGIITEDSEDNERSFNLSMAILDIDLESV